MVGARHRRTYQVTSLSICLLDGFPVLGRWGEVMAMFQRSCYVRGDRGEMMCIGGRNLDDGPLNLKAAFPPRYSMDALGYRSGCRCE